MRLTRNIFLIAVLLIGSGGIISAQTADRAGDARTGVATLLARDPLTQSLCFKDGGPGATFQAGQTRNRCSDLNFNSYSANAFSVGVEGGRSGVILDLGTADELKAKYGFTETVGRGQGFASISIKDGKALILKNYKAGTLQELQGAAVLFQPPISANANAPVKLGHIYLIRIADKRDKDFVLLAKILVVAYTPNESVTVRWALL